MRNCSFRRKAGTAGAEAECSPSASAGRWERSAVVAVGMIATAPADNRDGNFDDAVSVAFCRDAEESGDCIDGMFAQQGIAAMRLAVVVCCVMQQAAAQPGTMAATRTTAATIAAAQRFSLCLRLCPREITESSNRLPTIGNSRPGWRIAS
jgi:hypothetical protein